MHANSTGQIRRIDETDSLEELTDLLHRAYAGLAAMGFRYLATHQNTETTARRVAKGECYLMLNDWRIIGTILVIPPSHPAPHCEWYDRPDVSVLSQFAIEPGLQGQGLGGQLLRFAESRAALLGATEASVDTAEGATHLIRFYEARGYREVGRAQWGHTNYRSVLLSKRLTAHPSGSG
jgi:GNAT superfamily N-acetyltransferase